MKKYLITSLICLILLSAYTLAGIGKQEEVARLMAKADSLASIWDHSGAVEVYLEILKIDPNNYRACWKAGDEYTEVADRLPDKEKEKKELYFDKARKLCERAIEINPDGWEGHFRLAVALGRLALFRGGKEKIKLSKMIKAEADTALILNPNADLVYHVLGRWHQNLANLSGMVKFFAKVFFGGVPPGTNEEAVKMFKKAIEINPNHIEHYLELARTYKFMKRWDLMKEPLEKLLSLPDVEEDDPKFKQEAKEMLKKLNY